MLHSSCGPAPVSSRAPSLVMQRYAGTLPKAAPCGDHVVAFVALLFICSTAPCCAIPSLNSCSKLISCVAGSTVPVRMQASGVLAPLVSW